MVEIILSIIQLLRDHLGSDYIVEGGSFTQSRSGRTIFTTIFIKHRNVYDYTLYVHTEHIAVYDNDEVTSIANLELADPEIINKIARIVAGR